MPPPVAKKPITWTERWQGLGEVRRQVRPTLSLVWEADKRGAVTLAVLTLLAALYPPAIAWVGKLIIDAVVAASSNKAPVDDVFRWVSLELGLMVASTLTTRLTSLERELMRARLGNLINLRILDKALALELRHFEDSEVYDKMQNARREASARPLSLAMQLLTVAQNTVMLASFAALLVSLSPFAVVVIVLASIPAFIAEAKIASDSFRLWSWRAPEGRKLNYLEWILTRDSHVKEVKLFGLGELILGRYRALFQKFFDEDKRLAVRRASWGFGLGLVSLFAFYGAYWLVASRAARGNISLGDMALYLAVFRQGQTAFQQILTAVGSTYEDSLFMSNLFNFLSLPTSGETRQLASGAGASSAPSPSRGKVHAIEFRKVSFRYPGKKAWALRDINLVLAPGEKLGLVGENGAGKSTLVKLLMRLYEPTEGQILYGGVDLREMDAEDLRSRIGAVFQDFVRYQFPVSENIGLGDVGRLTDRPRIEWAAERGGAVSIITQLPQGYDTNLGGWFEAGQELSAGQWQKLAVSRAFMRDAEVLILDEPTASIDAEAEHELFERFQSLAKDRTAIVISHRFSTVRMADRIAVLNNGTIEELGSHAQLVAQGGRYAHLFQLQARGYLD